MLKELFLKNRSYRRFDQKVKLSDLDLTDMINAARLSASGRNAQSLKYILSNEESLNKLIFPTLAWAGYLKDWDGPTEGEQPAAYIIQLNDKNLSNNYYCDDGIAIQSILLTAVEKGFGGCIIASVKKDTLSAILNLPENLEILHVIALGKPSEKVVIEDIKDNDIKYWRDENNVHHVPKRKIEDLIVNFRS
ncbi:MAG: nitroreductase family protein [Bacteroidales bacterium]|nr:nitroreductase family protein [Bacteroidales bacterium]MCF8390331.1 nitroreductase family protein [Bacteroidales bacterium]